LTFPAIPAWRVTPPPGWKTFSNRKGGGGADTLQFSNSESRQPIAGHGDRRNGAG